MLQEYPTTRCSRKCHITGRPILPGEVYVSALIPRGSDLLRVDVSADQWTSVPEGTVGWWKCKMPSRDSVRLQAAPPGVLLDSLGELLQNPHKSRLAYLLALLLVRKRILVDDDSLEFQEPQQNSIAIWKLASQSDGRQWEVPVVLPNNSLEAEQLRQELMGLLFSEA